MSVDRSVCLSDCLSAPSQDFEQNRLVYGLYLLRMSPKLKNINLCLPHERERTSGSREKSAFHLFLALFDVVDLYLEQLLANNVNKMAVVRDQNDIIMYSVNKTCLHLVHLRHSKNDS